MNSGLNTVLRIAREEWRLLWRDRTATLALGLTLLLTIAAIFTAWDQRQTAHSERLQRQAQFDQEYDAQPDRNPHRMAHYGHFVFRPLSPLAAFDSGIDPYTGNTLFLEAHRQNSANFGDVRQSSLLLRFGQLTPAFVLQFLAPLLLIFIGHAALARERETGTLRALLAQGVSARQLVAGKSLAAVGMAALLLTPALLALLGLWVFASAPLALVLLLAASYALWLLLWAAGTVVASTCFARGRDALIALLAVWALTVVVLPRLGADWVSASLPLPTRMESEIAVIRDLVATGDRANPQDAHFTAFRANLLAQYGVEKVQDLPLNYKGLVGLEAERITSELFEQYAQTAYERQAEQLRRMDGLAWFSPLLALRRLSMTAAGSDFHEYRRFLEQAEVHRFQLMQKMDQLRAEHLRYEDDNYLDYERDNAPGRISHAHWHGLADFRHQPSSTTDTLNRTLPQAAVLLGWLALLLILLAWAGKRLAKVAS